MSSYAACPCCMYTSFCFAKSLCHVFFCVLQASFICNCEILIVNVAEICLSVWHFHVFQHGMFGFTIQNVQNNHVLLYPDHQICRFVQVSSRCSVAYILITKSVDLFRCLNMVREQCGLYPDHQISRFVQVSEHGSRAVWPIS